VAQVIHSSKVANRTPLSISADCAARRIFPEIRLVHTPFQLAQRRARRSRPICRAPNNPIRRRGLRNISGMTISLSERLTSGVESIVGINLNDSWSAAPAREMKR